MIRIKDGVKVLGLQDAMFFACGVLDVAFAFHGHDVEITSGVDGNHNSGSLHSFGLAVDVHTLGIPSEDMISIMSIIRGRLERYGFDVVSEVSHQTAMTTAPHLHIEYQPKPGERKSIFV